jgi:hypothetical protein
MAFNTTFNNISVILWWTVLLVHLIDLNFWCLMPLSAIFQLYHGDQFLVVEEAGVPERTMGKQLVSFITCGCKSSAPFFVIYKAGREPPPYW